MNFRIASTGICLGQKCVTDYDLDKLSNSPLGTIFNRTGVKNRYYADNQTIPQMAANAIRDALKKAKWHLNDIDAIISTAAVPYQFIPCTAIHIQRELGLGQSGIQVFDVNATCLGFLVACDLVSLGISNKKWKKVVIVSSEIASNGIHNANRIESFGLFGDAAVAACIEQGDNDSILYASLFESYGDYAELCQIVGGASRKPSYHFIEAEKDEYLFQMEGIKLFKQSSLLLPGFIQKLFSKNLESDAPKSVDDLDCVIPHQASAAALNLTRRRLKIPEEKWINIVENYGNCISASIPLTLHIAHQNQQLKRGMKTLLLGTGAGLSLGGLILRF